jgi:hypothetical protein
MTAEKVENTGTEKNEADKESEAAKSTSKTTTRSTKKEVVALSVKGQSGDAKGLNLFTPAYGLPENRPIGASHLMFKIGEGMPQNRPIEVSHLKIVSTYNSIGATRPVGASGMEISSTLAISGHRPISVSHLHISETFTVMGNRPVASNEIDDPITLMGFLD